MISFLDGILKHKSPTEAVVDVQGVGYLVHIPVSTYEKLDGLNERVRIFTYLHVRENAMQLYGFMTEAEREMFRLLISVSGIGPRIAQSILSGTEVGELRECIANGDTAALTSIQGVGRKTAERIVVELRDKLAKVEEASISFAPTGSPGQLRAEAVGALVSLGYARANAENILRTVIKEADGATLSVEELVKRALRHSSK
jgi:Holliday junction DNA helicase RuvA